VNLPKRAGHEKTFSRKISAADISRLRISK
jgi:hypothetical protein